MKKIEVEGGGYPGTSKTFRQLRDISYQVGQLAANLAGDAIVSGLEVNGGNASAGMVVMNGELYPCAGGTVKDWLKVVETAEKVQYLKDDNGDGQGDLIDGYIDRVLVFTDVEADADATFAGLTRIKDVAELSRQIPPKSVALPYFGSVTDIKAGWQLCDGSNGTPDLRDMFVVGYNADNPDYDEIGKTGGQDEVTLSENQMPQHSHSGTTNYGGSHDHTLPHSVPYGDPNGTKEDELSHDGNINQSRVSRTNIGGSHYHTLTTNNAGGNEAHENRPRWYALAYIAYVG